ncbi:MAG: RNA polymerase sigma-70 factor [Prevotella sp.]|jgi:RNA polymerase sigma-70 factor (ECF subfamily)|nr:RNA polymerase sigma-70 factor [Prevotella sp.]
MRVRNEQELVIALINDDESAFCELYASYKERLIYFAIKFTKSQDFAEDIFHDTFVAVWQNRKFLNPNQSFSSYLHTIMKNRLLNILYSIDKESELKKIIKERAIDSGNDTENTIIDKDLNELLDKAIDNLTPQQKRIFELSRGEMKTHKEIADELNISVYTVQQHISTALKTIRTYLAKYTGTYADIILLLICLNC